MALAKPWPTPAPLSVSPQLTHLLPLGGWEGAYLPVLEATAWLLYSYVTQGRSLNFSEPCFAHLSNGCDHFEHHSGSKTKQVGVQTLGSL